MDGFIEGCFGGRKASRITEVLTVSSEETMGHYLWFNGRMHKD